MKPKEKEEKSLSSHTSSFQTELLDIVLEGQDLGLTDDELRALTKKARSYVELEPDALRVCNRECPAHDMCPFIKDVDINKRPYGARCPMEAMRYKHEFDTFAAYVASIDHEGNPIPAAELGMCKELAFMAVVEHRAKIELAKDPSLVQVVAVPGGGGATAKSENPSYRHYLEILRNKRELQRMLYKMAADRLKQIEIEKEESKTTKSIKRQLDEIQDSIKNTSIGNLLADAEKNIKENKKNKDSQLEME